MLRQLAARCAGLWQRAGAGERLLYEGRFAACPVSTRGGTRRVQLVRGEGLGVSDQYEGRGGGGRPRPQQRKDPAGSLRACCPDGRRGGARADHLDELGGDGHPVRARELHVVLELGLRARAAQIRHAPATARAQPDSADRATLVRGWSVHLSNKGEVERAGRAGPVGEGEGEVLRGGARRERRALVGRRRVEAKREVAHVRHRKAPARGRVPAAAAGRRAQAVEDGACERGVRDQDVSAGATARARLSTGGGGEPAAGRGGGRDPCRETKWP